MYGVNFFVGSYAHNVDPKNRLFVPAKFRDGLTGTFNISVFRSKDYPCIQCFNEEQFAPYVQQEIDRETDVNLKRRISVWYLGFAADVTVDSQGRINIPQNLLEKARIEKEALIVGMGDHVEIWNPALFEAYNETVDAWTKKNEIASEQASDAALERKAQGGLLGI